MQEDCFIISNRSGKGFFASFAGAGDSRCTGLLKLYVCKGIKDCEEK